MRDTLLVELLTEELPPKSLESLGSRFAEGIGKRLQELGFVEAGAGVTAYSSPRRLAVSIEAVLGEATRARSRAQGPRRGLGHRPRRQADQGPGGLRALLRRGGRRARQDARRQGRVLRVPLPQGRRSHRRASGRNRAGRHQGTADPEAHALGRAARICSCALCTASSSCTAPAWCPGRSSGSKPATPLAGTVSSRAGELRIEHARDYARILETEGGASSQASTTRAERASPSFWLRPRATASLRRSRRAAQRGHRAGRESGGLRRPLRRGLPGRAAGMPDPVHAAASEVLPAARSQDRPAAEPVPDRQQPRDRRSAQHHRRQRACAARTPGGRQVLLRSGPQGAARRTRASGSVPWSITTSWARQLERVQRHPQARRRHRREAARRLRQGRARRLVVQGGPRERHGRRVPRAAGHHGRILRTPRRRGRRGGRAQSRRTTTRASPATRCPKTTSAPQWPWPTSSTPWSASTASGSSPPATRIPSACAARRSACCASWPSGRCRST